MSESTNPMPFVCKWLDAHSKSQYFETAILFTYVRAEGYKKSHNNNIMLEEHLLSNLKLNSDSGEVYRDVLVKGTLIRMPPIRFKKGSWTQRTLCL
ncbi:unnamed protein product [Rhizophagus irregularis]|nr:unnamed protein product [Rhizophagus irregularis]CAB4488478.1 unnamed protein product [Rhizophagus irregularis]CAB5323733.1 unnamed protein product [Rhizophagus irregularis]